MATILYKKFFKKAPQGSNAKACIHQEGPETSSTRYEESSDLVHMSTFPGDTQQLTPEKTAGQSVRGDGGATTPCLICKEEKKAATKYRWKLIIGLFLPFSVQALDTTIIAGALPFIASDFNQLSQLNWIVSAFNLTSAAFIPFWGQFADVFGRYPAIQSALIVTVIGSAFCSGAPTTAFAMLLVGRALQGLGCAGLLIITKIVLADKVSLQENARNNTVFTIVGGIGYGIGPTIGGYLTQANWRWCFIINVPIGVVGIVLAHFVLRPELLGPQKITRTDGNLESEEPQTFKAKLSTIDFGGQFLFLFGVGLLVLALTWAGSYYPWSDIKVIIPLVIGAILIIVFLTWEFFMLPGRALAIRYPTRKPMIPFKLLWTRNLGLLMYINFTTGMAMYAVFYFVDLYFALVRSYTPGESGTNLAFYLPGLAVGAYMAMYACNVWPLQTFFPLFLGTVLEPLGITLLAAAIHQGYLHMVFGMLALTGVGTGIRFMPGTLHGIGYFPNSISSIVSLMSLSLTLGGTISTTLMLNIFNNTLRKSGISFSSDSSSSFNAISSLPTEEQDFLRGKARSGIVIAFYALTAFLWLGVVAMFTMGNVRIGKKGKDGVLEKDRVIRGSYLGSLFWKRGRGEVTGIDGA